MDEFGLPFCFLLFFSFLLIFFFIPSEARTRFDSLSGGRTPYLLGDRTPMVGDRTPMIGDRTPMIGDRTPMIGDRTPAPGDQTPGWGGTSGTSDYDWTNQFDHREPDFSTVTPSFDNTVSPYGIGTPNVMVCFSYSFYVYFLKLSFT